MHKIYILWLRQIKRYLRSRSRIVGALAQPMLYLMALGYGFGAVFQQAGQGSYLTFLTPGVIGMTIIFTSMFSGMEVIWDRQFGFLKETLVAPMPRFNVMLGRTLGGATVATIQALIVLVASLFFGFRPTSWPLLLAAIPCMFLVALLFTALGTAVASGLSDMQGFQLIMNFLVMPLFFFSGAIYPLEGLPRALSLVVSINPLTYGVDAFRGLLINSSHYGLATDIAVLCVATFAFLYMGSRMFERIEA
ncbi:MAG: multidrug ABC transporter permease [Gammaproteobacteria bacterium]|nr:MAG: multidrug ABC transporter permease [Gammaproteobacteria bacterium]